MKKYFYSGTLIFAAWSLLTVSPTLSAAANVTLKYANFFPPTHSQSKLAEAWCKAVEEKTGVTDPGHRRPAQPKECLTAVQ